MKEKDLLNVWQQRLDLAHYVIIIERISPFQVTDGERRRANSSLVGIRPDGDRRALLFHTRRLKEIDIIHELLHLAHSDWPDEQIEAEALNLLKTSSTRFSGIL